MSGNQKHVEPQCSAEHATSEVGLSTSSVSRVQTSSCRVAAFRTFLEEYGKATDVFFEDPEFQELFGDGALGPDAPVESVSGSIGIVMFMK